MVKQYAIYSKGVPTVDHAHGLMTRTALDPPGSVQLMDIQNGQAMIGWTPVDSCAPVQYTISSNCSTCSPTTTNLTTSSCPLSEPSADDNIVCTFSIQSAVCDGLIGNSSTLVVALQSVWYSRSVGIIIDDSVLATCLEEGRLGFSST